MSDVSGELRTCVREPLTPGPLPGEREAIGRQVEITNRCWIVPHVVSGHAAVGCLPTANPRLGELGSDLADFGNDL